MKSSFRFRLAQAEDKPRIVQWLAQDHIKAWIHGIGLNNLLVNLDKFFQGVSDSQHWLAYVNDTPFAYLLTSPKGDDAITLDLFICDLNYVGKGLAVPLIQTFLTTHFSHVKRVLIDPEATNTRAVHVYEKVGFKTIGEFIAHWHPVPHYQMELAMSDLLYHFEHTEHPTADEEEILFNGINAESFLQKKLPPIKPFGIFIKDRQGTILGGMNGITFYGCVYIDQLWLKEELRQQGLRTRLMQEAEQFGRKRHCTFATVNTMDWEALPFYQKLGYEVEFIRTGFQHDSKMYFLKKLLY